MTAPAPPQRGPDPEAEQEVDFARYVKLLGVRWWLLAAGLVAGAVIGYLVSLGGSQVYSAAASVYLGQPYTPTGGALVQDPQTNPSSVGQVVNSAAVINTVANLCHASRGCVQEGNLHAGGRQRRLRTKGSAAAVNPLVKVSVQSKKGKVAACAANQLAAKVVKKLGVYPAAKIKNLKAHIAVRQRGHRHDPAPPSPIRTSRTRTSCSSRRSSAGPARQDHELAAAAARDTGRVAEGPRQRRLEQDHGSQPSQHRRHRCADRADPGRDRRASVGRPSCRGSRRATATAPDLISRGVRG